jgi:hypothetical protein
VEDGNGNEIIRTSITRELADSKSFVCHVSPKESRGRYLVVRAVTASSQKKGNGKTKYILVLMCGMM